MGKRKPFTIFDNGLLDTIIQCKFSDREQRLLRLVHRLSVGCGHEWAIFHRWGNAGVAGIGRNHVRDTIYSLAKKRVLKASWKRKGLRINMKLDQWRVDRWPDNGFQDLLKYNLGNGKVPDTGTNSVKKVPKTGTNGDNGDEKVPDSGTKSSQNRNKIDEKVPDTGTSDAVDAGESKAKPPPKERFKESKESKSKRTDRQTILPNGMTREAFNSLLEYKVGVIKLRVEENDKYRQALEREPEEKLIEAVEYVKSLEKPPMIRYILERIHGYIDQWDYHQKQKGEAPPTLQQQLDAEIARLDNFQKQLDAKPQFVDELAIEMLASIQENVDYFKKEIQDADTATAS